MTVIGFQTKGVSGAWISEYGITLGDGTRPLDERTSFNWEGNTDDTTLVTKYMKEPAETDEIALVVQEIGGATPTEFEMEWDILVCIE